MHKVSQLLPHSGGAPERVCPVARSWKFFVIPSALLLVFGVTALEAQTTVSASPSLQYLKPYAVPTILRAPLAALGDRLQSPGKERFTVTGTYSDGKADRPIQFTWELPGKMRIDLGGGSPRSVVYDGTASGATGGAATSSDDDLMESLADDRTEGLLYNLHQSGFAMRFLGSRFRTDNGLNKNYAGPYYDLFQTAATVSSRSDKASRHKLFIFDSLTGAFVQTKYEITRAGAAIMVETIHSGGTTIAGQAVPNQIIRRENGTTVFTITVATAQVAPTANDGLVKLP